MKRKNKAWFKSLRGSYLPVSLMGWLTYIPFLGYLLFTLVEGITKTSSTALAIMYLVPNWIAAAVVMTYIAARKS